MIRHLVVLQFPFLILTAILAGLELFWISRPGIWIYIAAVFLLPALHVALKRADDGIRRPPVFVLLSLAGLGLAVWAYKPLHQGFWDGGAPMQAIQLVLLALISLAVSHAAAYGPWGSKHGLGVALVVFALAWALATLYPLLPLLAGGVILGLAPLVLGEKRQVERNLAGPIPGPGAGLAAGVLFLAALELGATIADFQQDTVWAGQLALAFIAAAAGGLLGARIPRRLGFAALLIGASLLASAVFADFVIHLGHALAVGLALGLALSDVSSRRGGAGLVAGGLLWGGGVAASLVLSQHRILFEFRWVLVLLIPVLLWRDLRYRARRPVDSLGES